MRLMSFRSGGRERFGARTGDWIIDLHRASLAYLRSPRDSGQAGRPGQPVASDLAGLLELGEPGLRLAREAVRHVLTAYDEDWRVGHGVAVKTGEVQWLPPVTRPRKILCVGRNYAGHVEEVGGDVPPVPVLFTRFAETLVPHQGAIVRPAASGQLDWEGELAVVIGAPARHVSEADAYRAVAGYSLFNDASVRDFQLRTSQFTAGKNFDATAPFGPELVTADEVADPHALTLEVTVNGETVQRASTGRMIFSIPRLIAHISEWTTLRPGDVIATGTPAGVGHSRRPPRYLVPGDVVRVAADGLGALENRVDQERWPAQ